MTSANKQLQDFTGTEHYYKHEISNYQYTDGIKMMAEKFAAYWLIDLAFSHQLKPKLKMEDFQVWELKRQHDNFFVAFCTDGNDNTLVLQKIEFSDFPFDHLKMYLVDKILLLPSEY